MPFPSVSRRSVLVGILAGTGVGVGVHHLSDILRPDGHRHLGITNETMESRMVAVRFEEADTGEIAYEGEFVVPAGDSDRYGRKRPGYVLPGGDLVLSVRLDDDHEETTDLPAFSTLVVHVIAEDELEVRPDRRGNGAG